MPFWKKPAETAGTDPELWLVVGLGNPGREYAGTRHNIGFMVVDTLAQRHGLTFKNSRHRAETARGRIGEVPVMLALPLTYMNQSGTAVSRLLAYYEIRLDHLLVVCDDLDLPFGTLRIRPRGSSGGNGGLKSIVEQLKSDEFARLRIGVGRPRDDAIRHVLGRFPPEQARSLPQLLNTAADAVTVALNRGIPDAMNEFNRDWLPSLSVT